MARRLAIVTINPNEAAAVEDYFLDEARCNMVDSRDASQRMIAYSWKTYQIEDRLVDHLDLKQSGNLTAAVVANRFFSRPNVRSDEYDAIILFGCAGANPIVRDPCSVGDYVLVGKATFVENGSIVTITDSQRRSVDVALLKTDRLTRHEIEMSGGVIRRLQNELKLPVVSCLCTEKIFKLDLSVTVKDYNTDTEQTYRGLLGRGHRIIDMESFGFLIGLSALQLRRTAVLRVVTDSMSDHGESTQSQGRRESPQLTMLSAAARELLPRILAVLDADGPALPSEEQDLQADAAVEEAITAMEAGETDAESAFRELEPIAAQVVDPFGETAADPETRLLQDLAKTRRLGYGTARLGTTIRERDSWKFSVVGAAAQVAAALGGLAGVSPAVGLTTEVFADLARIAWIGRYDPTTPGKYTTAVRKALAIRGSEADVSDLRVRLGGSFKEGELPQGVQGAVIELDPPLVLVPREWFRTMSVENVRAWDGYDDDALLDALFGLPRL
jgi:hypothetical protein